jgi:hypothetical protein
MNGSRKFVFSIGLVLAVASAAAAQSWFGGTVDEAVAKAKAERKLVLIDFYSGG